MQRWEKHWFGPVAAIRPYLFQKCFTLMIAFDLLVLMVERGARYGAEGQPFNVAHFGWLDAVHSRLLPGGLPGATYYVAVLAITSFFSFCLFFGGHRRWLAAIVCALFTYGWSMSRLDSYLHHYMLSLIMLCMVYFPRVDARELASWLAPEELHQSKKSKRKITDSALGTGSTLGPSLGLVILALAFAYRFALSGSIELSESARWVAMIAFFGLLCGVLWWGSKNTRKGSGPAVSAWSFRLLLTTVGVIYIFAAVAKMDGEWIGGHTLKAVGTTEAVLNPVAQFAESMGIPGATFWAGLATFVIPLELILAGIYIFSVWQDEPGRKLIASVCFVGWLLAIGLHLNNEMMNLIIQWFGYYMLLLATLSLLPARLLLIAGQAFIVPEVWVREQSEKILSELQAKGLVGRCVLSTILAVVLILSFGLLTLSIPGTVVASGVLMFGLIVAVAICVLFGWGKRILGTTTIAAVAAMAMICAVRQSSMQFDYWDLRGKTLMNLRGTQTNLDAALLEMTQATNALEAATAFTAPSLKASGELHTNLAICYVREGKVLRDASLTDDAKSRFKKAESAFRQATTDDPSQFLAYYSYGNLLLDQQRFREAQQQYLSSLAIKPDFSSAYVNLGSAYQSENRWAEALDCFEHAAQIEPNAQDIQQFLMNAKKRLAESQ